MVLVSWRQIAFSTSFFLLLEELSLSAVEDRVERVACSLDSAAFHSSCTRFSPLVKSHKQMEPVAFLRA